MYKDRITSLNVLNVAPWGLSEKADRYLRTKTTKRQTYTLTQEKTAGIFDAHVPSELNLLKVQKKPRPPREKPQGRGYR